MTYKYEVFLEIEGDDVGSEYVVADSELDAKEIALEDAPDWMVAKRAKRMYPVKEGTA